MLLLGHWLWTDEGWHPPPLCRGAVDLAAPAQIAAARPGQPRGVGLFLCDALPVGWDGAVLSAEDPRDARPDGRMLDAFESMAGYRPAGDTLADCAVDMLTAGADPGGLDRAKPLVPTHRGNLELWLGTLVWSRRFRFGSDAHTAMLVDLLRRDMLAIRADSIDGRLIDARRDVDHDFHRRVARALCEKYQCGFGALRPASWPVEETPLGHETTLAESFNTADSDTLGPDLAWTEVLGDLDIVSNRVQHAASGMNDRCARTNSSLASADHYAQIDRTYSSPDARNTSPCARFAAAATTYYVASIMTTSSGIYKRVAGTYTLLQAISGDSSALTTRLQCSGTSLEAFKNGGSVATATDSAISGNLQVGFQIRTFGDHGDNFEAADLAAGAGHPAIRRLGAFRNARPLGTTGPRIW